MILADAHTQGLQQRLYRRLLHGSEQRLRLRPHRRGRSRAGGIHKEQRARRERARVRRVTCDAMVAWVAVAMLLADRGVNLGLAGGLCGHRTGVQSFVGGAAWPMVMSRDGDRAKSK